MAGFEQKELTGALFKNKRKEKLTHPDYQGSAKINGVEFWVSSWINKPKAGGDTYISMVFKPKEEGQSSGNSSGNKTPPNNNYDNYDDDIPFMEPFHEYGLWRSV